MFRAAKRIYNSEAYAQQMRKQKIKERDMLQKAWAKFIESYIHYVSCWHGRAWFATFTTQYTMTLPSARRAVERFADITKRKGHTMTLCWFAESYELKDGFHLHALVSSTASRSDLNEYWATASRANRTHSLQLDKENIDLIFIDPNNPKLRELMKNRSNFKPLKRGLKGGTYASKYVTKSGYTTDYDIVL